MLVACNIVRMVIAVSIATSGKTGRYDHCRLRAGHNAGQIKNRHRTAAERVVNRTNFHEEMIWNHACRLV